MKIRRDFVTNSSSSSYIIARNKNCTKEEILNILKNKADKEEIISCSTCCEEYARSSDEEIFNDVIEKFADYLMDIENGWPDAKLKLGDWEIVTLYLHDDSEDLMDNLIMNAVGISTENLKFGY